MYRHLRPLLFRLEAERAHGLGLALAGAGALAPGLVRRPFAFAHARLEQTVFGLRFSNPVGLAAGFDKDARRVGFWPAMGFGSAEVGSVTARPSAGNPRPRAFRLAESGALVNRMGLNNAGAEAVAARLGRMPKASRPSGFVLGVNVAKTHSPAILGEAALDDFAESVRLLLPHADYLALNVSCPNTAEGKTFEDPDALDALLTRVMAERLRQGARTPVLVKLGPPSAGGLDRPLVDETLALCQAHGVAGLVASNTAADREGLQPSARLQAVGAGGLSGRPLAARALALTRYLYRQAGQTLPVIGVGGVDSPEEAYARVRAGASLVQLYTGLVYEGPGLPGRINRGLVRRLDTDGLATLADAVGLDA